MKRIISVEVNVLITTNKNFVGNIEIDFDPNESYDDQVQEAISKELKKLLGYKKVSKEVPWKWRNSLGEYMELNGIYEQEIEWYLKDPYKNLGLKEEE